jgi:hypothetical protein
MDGRAYSKNKEAFKQLLKKYGIYWKGTFQDPWWGSATEKVRAEYERDQERNITISATLIWEGEGESPFLKEFKAWCLDLKAEDTSKKVSQTRGTMDEILLFDMVYKPQEAYLETTGRPRSWIDKDLERFEAERNKKFGARPGA